MAVLVAGVRRRAGLGVLRKEGALQMKQGAVTAKVAKRKPTTARRILKGLWSKVKVQSCADGTFRILPVWRKKYRRPGVLTRMYAASQAEQVIRGE